eukprot:TRINITY_DN1754_c0_g1_i2.p1 TRINITY_DN1754_c0_g1~~TRINITY_DN1754_c0_g1_i2.p1  ORF type:complete len:436 (-),score=123.36 TRINITY_DN1754_c0_g1_i2:55-1362(-)
MAGLKRQNMRVAKSKAEFPMVDRVVVPPTRTTVAAILSDIPRRGSSVTKKVEKIAISNAPKKSLQAMATHKPIVSVQCEPPMTAVVEKDAQQERKPIRPPFAIFEDLDEPELTAQASAKQVVAPEPVAASEQQQETLRTEASSEKAAVPQELVEQQVAKKEASVACKVAKKVRFVKRVVFENIPLYQELDMSEEAKQSRTGVENSAEDAKKAAVGRGVKQPLSTARAVDVADKENVLFPCHATLPAPKGVDACFEDTPKLPLRRQVRFGAAIPQEQRCILEAVPMPLGQPIALNEVQFASARQPEQQHAEQHEEPLDLMEVDEVANEHLPQLEQQDGAVKHVRFAACTAIVALDMSQEAVDYRRNERDETYEACHFSVRAILSRDRRFYNDARHAERALQCALERAMQNRKLNSSARFAFVVNGRARVLDYLCGV